MELLWEDGRGLVQDAAACSSDPERLLLTACSKFVRLGRMGVLPGAEEPPTSDCPGIRQRERVGRRSFSVWKAAAKRTWRLIKPHVTH